MFDRRAQFAFVLACATLVASFLTFRVAVGVLNVYLKKEPVDLREHFDNIPTRIGSWAAVGDPAAKLSAEMIEELGTRLYLDREYQRDEQSARNPMSVHLAYYTGMIDAVPHVPDRCMIAAGFNARTRPVNYPMPVDRDRWTRDDGPVNRRTGEPYWLATWRSPISGQSVPVRMPLGDFELRTIEFSRTDLPNTRIYGGYFFVANGQIAVTPEEVKAFAFDKTEEFAYYCKVQFVTAGGPEYTAEQFVKEATDLLNELLPHLMRCLPDWATIEGRSSSEANPGNP